MSDMPFFSIIIPVYNVEEYLCECVQSVVNQSFDDYEILLIDDGSTDGSGKLCDKLANQFGKITVYHKKNGGSSDARNYGIKHAKGTYIAFIDSDDYWISTDALTIINRYLQNKPVDILCFNYVKKINNKYSQPYFPDKLVMKDTDNPNEFFSKHQLWSCSAWNKIVRTELLTTNDLFFRSGVTSEDIEWCARLLIASKSIAYADFVGYCYRMRKNSISHSMNYNKTIQLIDNLLFTHQIVLECNEIQKSILLKEYLGFLVGTLVLNLSNIKDKIVREKLVESSKPLFGYLKYSRNKKIKAMWLFYKFLGLNTTFFITQILSRNRGF